MLPSAKTKQICLPFKTKGNYQQTSAYRVALNLFCIEAVMKKLRFHHRARVRACVRMCVCVCVRSLSICLFRTVIQSETKRDQSANSESTTKGVN